MDKYDVPEEDEIQALFPAGSGAVTFDPTRLPVLQPKTETKNWLELDRVDFSVVSFYMIHIPFS